MYLFIAGTQTAHTCLTRTHPLGLANGANYQETPILEGKKESERAERSFLFTDPAGKTSRIKVSTP